MHRKCPVYSHMDLSDWTFHPHNAIIHIGDNTNKDVSYLLSKSS